MPLAWAILMRAVSDILDNAVAALRISVLPLVIFQFVGVHWLEMAIFHQNGFMPVPGRFVWWMWALGLLGTVLPTLWIAVAWHRFVVLKEEPWFLLPRINMSGMTRYALKFVPTLLMVLLWTVLFSLAIVVVIVILGQIVTAGSGPADFRIDSESLIGAALANIFFFRYGGALVGAAVGGESRLSQAWNRTSPARWSMVWLAALVMVLTVALDWITGFLALRGIVLGGYELASSWFIMMLNVGLLTTIYMQLIADPPP